ncbi:MAG: transcriptional regulator, family, partial [Thermoleophilia bacterium]|nr:transcriptional regulator, family [Thermoleophilia bacterium]
MPSWFAMTANHEPSPATEPDRVDARVRRRLRELRAERGLTLRQVADRANIDLSTLSRLEMGKRRLALDHLQPLAGALGVSVDDLLGVRPAIDPRVHAEPQRADGLTMWPLTRSTSARGLQTFKVVIDATRNRPPTPLPVHEGHDWIYVMSGRMRLLLGDDDHTIEPGEAVEFSTWVPHWFGAIDTPVELLAILGAQ